MIGIVFWASVALVAYTYAGYPLIVTLAASVAGRDRAYPRATPKVTLVIAAYNEEKTIGPKLDEALTLDYPRELLHVVVAADGSDDHTASIVAGYGDRGVELVHCPERRGKMAAINRAMQWARGEIVLFSDANNRLRPNALAEILRPFSDPSVGAVTGRKTVAGGDGLGFSESAYWRYESHLRRMETRLGCTVGVNGEIFAMRRDLFVAPPDGVINDDQWLAAEVIRSGYRVVFRPEAVSEEPVSALAAEEVERRSRMVAGQYQAFSGLSRLPWRRPLVLWMLVSHKLLRPLVPFGMIGALGSSIAAAVAASPTEGIGGLGQPWGLAALLAQAAFYGVAAIGRSLPGRLGKVAYVPRFLVDSNLAALHGLWRHLRGTQAAAWRRAPRSGP